MKGIYLHNFASLAERSYEEFAARLATGGVTELRPKTHQWLSWNGAPKSGGYDSSPLGIRALADLARVRDAFAPHGIRVTPWCVPMGLDVEAEAQMAASVAAVCGRLDFDVEPYQEFWPAIAAGDYSAVEPFFRRVRALVGDQVELTLDFPARDSSWEWGRMRLAVQLAASYVDRLAVQSYFGAGQAADAAGRIAAVSGLPLDQIGDVAHVAEMVPLWQAGTRALVWEAAAMTPAAYGVLAGVATRPEQPPAPPPAPVVGWQEPGFAELARQGVITGDPLGDPYPDNWGNVLQDGVQGTAIWVKRLNRNAWVPR